MWNSNKEYFVSKSAAFRSRQFVVSPIPKVSMLANGEQSDPAGTVQIYAGYSRVLQRIQ